MPLGQSQDIPQADPRGMATPRFWHRLNRFRHVISSSLALASLNHTCRNLVSTFPQRSPPLLLTTAACGGLRSTPDCRPRRALLHLSYSYATPCGPALLVTQCHRRSSHDDAHVRWPCDPHSRHGEWRAQRATTHSRTNSRLVAVFSIVFPSDRAPPSLADIGSPGARIEHRRGGRAPLGSARS